jgi:16S rRNA (cytosine1402-N4)-methyltransferase
MYEETQNTNIHIPVLLQQTIEYLSPKDGDKYLDLTAGYGGHARAILEYTKHPEKALFIDRDQKAVTHLKSEFAEQGVEILQADYLSASEGLAEQKRQFDCILADLGTSSPHLDQASRGFAISQDGPLDMRMDQTQELDAYVVVNQYSEKELAALLREYGEEPKAHQIASLIVHNRPLRTTTELANIVARAWPGRSKVHPATRTFQAIRIVVNDELALLRKSLPLWIDELLAPGGRIAVISFHSLEDRLVKQAFQEAGGDRYDATLRILTKHPVTGEQQELVSNPRARSAKLRAAAKIKT